MADKSADRLRLASPGLSYPGPLGLRNGAQDGEQLDRRLDRFCPTAFARISVYEKTTVSDKPRLPGCFRTGTSFRTGSFRTGTRAGESAVAVAAVAPEEAGAGD